MKILLLDSHDQVMATLQNPGEFDQQSPSDLFKLLDFLEMALRVGKKSCGGDLQPLTRISHQDQSAVLPETCRRGTCEDVVERSV